MRHGQNTTTVKSHDIWRRIDTDNDLESIISFRVFNRRIIVLNDANSVRDLLQKRADIYSDRPKSWMYHEICDRKKAVFNISSTDERHRQYRRLLHTGLGPRAVQQYWPLIQSETETLLDGFAKSPRKYEHHIRRYDIFFYNICHSSFLMRVRLEMLRPS